MGRRADRATRKEKKWLLRCFSTPRKFMPWRRRRFAEHMDREAEMPTQQEIDRRYAKIRAAMAANHIDALIVCGNQYAGFEGAIRYVSGFEIVHRYVYALLPLSGEPMLVFPREARWIGDKKAPWVRDQVWPEIPGKWLGEKIDEKRSEEHTSELQSQFHLVCRLL